MSIKLLAVLAILGLAAFLAAPRCLAATPQWGAYVDGNNLASFESLVGKPANVQAVFVGWGSGGPFPSQYKSSLADKGKTLLIFWEPSVNYDSILSGSYDSYMSSFAAAAKSYGGQVILAPFHEMNGNWDVWDGTVGTNTPAKLISAWRRMHGFFAGAANVKFAWAVNNDSVPDTAANAITAYYPGDAYVDYVGVDGFNFGGQTWSSTLASALTTVKQYNKPVYIFSTASCPGTAKAQWIKDMAAGVAQYNVAGWVWFNANKECDWRVNSDANSLAAFKAMISQATASAPANPTAATGSAPATSATPGAKTSPTQASSSGSGSAAVTNSGAGSGAVTGPGSASGSSATPAKNSNQTNHHHSRLYRYGYSSSYHHWN